MIALPFPVYGMRFEVQFERAFTLPPFPGSLLRGVFGAALRALSCMTGFRSCDNCPLIATCPYPALFEPSARNLDAVGLGRLQVGMPPPFILRVGTEGVAADGRYAFTMRLVGEASTRIAYVIEAWRRALARGLGAERVRGLVTAVSCEQSGATVWQEDAAIQPPQPLQLAPPPTGAIELVTRSPLRLQTGGTLTAPGQMQPRLLVGAIVRRARLLASHADAGAQRIVRDWPVDDWLNAADTIAHQPQFAQHNWYRYSGRQRRRMNLGGLVGQWRWRDTPAEITELAALGGLLHVGKEASFGLGAYELRAA